jgi:hypothetical protein
MARIKKKTPYDEWRETVEDTAERRRRREYSQAQQIRTGVMKAPAEPLRDLDAIRRRLPASPEARGRAAEVSERFLAGTAISRIATQEGISRARAAQLDLVGRHVLSYLALGLLKSID